MKNWFYKLRIKLQFCFFQNEPVREVFTWHGRLFVLTRHTLYEIFRDHNDETVITCRKWLDPEFNLESYIEHG